jgi:circadian clock protein KaiC
VGISSLADTWLLLRDIEIGGERNRGMYILKSRGMPHSNQIREFVLTSHGIRLLDVYTGPEGVVTGSARLVLETREREKEVAIRRKIERIELDMEARRRAMEGRVEEVRSGHESERSELLDRIDEMKMELQFMEVQKKAMASSRMAQERDRGGQGG